MTEGVLEINLQGTTVKALEAKSWLGRMFQKLVGVKTVEQEVATQLQYLEKVYEVFRDLVYENLLSFDLNGKNVYYDEAYTDKDFQTAIQLAVKEEQEEAYHVEFTVHGIDGNEENEVEVNMYAQHEEGDMPLVVTARLNQPSAQVEVFLTNVKDKINEKFGIESGDISVDEDYEEESGDEPAEESSEETSEETATESTETEESEEDKTL